MKVLFVSGSKNDVTQLWYSSGCHIRHTFEHLAITGIDNLSDDIHTIRPDVVIVSYNVGSQSYTGVDVVTIIQEEFPGLMLVENTYTEEESFARRNVFVDSNIECDPERLSILLGIMA